MHAVVGHARFFTENGDFKGVRRSFIQKIFYKAMTHHAVANNREPDFAHICLKFDVYAPNIGPCRCKVLMQINRDINLPPR